MLCNHPVAPVIGLPSESLKLTKPIALGTPVVGHLEIEVSLKCRKALLHSCDAALVVVSNEFFEAQSLFAARKRPVHGVVQICLLRQVGTRISFM